MQETLGWEDPLEEGMATTPVFLPGESYGQGSLAGYSLWSLKESDTTEQLSKAYRIEDSNDSSCWSMSYWTWKRQTLDDFHVSDLLTGYTLIYINQESQG